MMFLLTTAFGKQREVMRELASWPSPSLLMHMAHRLYSSNVAYDDEVQEDQRRAVKFASMEKRRVPRPPYYRPPIYFPDVTLQMMKPSNEQLNEIKATGWTREVAFKTTPNVTKPEIKAILETMYGMEVERVNTINYLGRKHVTFPAKTSGKFPKRHLWREDDWKKAYVIFKPPKSQKQGGNLEEEVKQTPEVQKDSKSMIDQLLEAKGLLKTQK